MRRAVGAAFPAGLPDWDPVRCILQGRETLEADLEVNTCQIIPEHRVCY